MTGENDLAQEARGGGGSQPANRDTSARRTVKTANISNLACRQVYPMLPCVSMLHWKQCSAVEQMPGKVGGVWLFTGTRVPVKALFENLEDGATVEDFLAWFPGVTREQVRAVLEFAEQSLALS